MVILTGITETRPNRSVRDALRGPAILGFCFALAAAFATTVWAGPVAPQRLSTVVVASALP
ncbi:MAG TPA: hypothetical protein VMK12_01040 [Anaeromyxobacteraceae bacterium]|nr:hypothetical protein [Anaeromyxobacteraceae bacterium]